MKRKVLGVIVVVLVVWGAWTLLGNRQASFSTVKIGFIGPLTGDASTIGEASRAAAEIAVDEVNAAGGINGKKLEVVYEDGRCNATAAVNAANKLISVDKVKVIIGGACSTETSAFGPTAMASKVVAFSYCSSAPTLSALGKYFLRSYPSDSFQGKFAAEYAYDTLKTRKVAVLYHVSEWGTGIKTVFENRFRELGGSIVSEDGAPQDARDYRTMLTKAKALLPDLIYAPTYPDGGTVLLTQASELGMKTQFLGADGWGDPKLWKAVSGKGNFLFTTPMNSSPDEFRQKVFAKTGGKDIPVCTTNAYDNMKMIAEVLKKVGATDTDAIQSALRAMKYDGVSGHIEFDANGDVTVANYSVNRMHDGTATEVK